MFRPTKAFQDTITNYPQEPSLRIGRSVPKNAVNLAYYYNPTATDAEKILTAEAPRNTIDHRVEEAYRYLFDQASANDDLFPAFVPYEDEEGYTGKLGRMFVQWNPETHVLTKPLFDVKKDIIVTNKADIPKTIDYADLDGYTGTLFLDTVTYEVSKERDDTAYEQVERQVLNFELVYHKIFNGNYIPAGPGGAIDSWVVGPNESSSARWPKKIRVGETGLSAINCSDSTVRFYVQCMANPFDGAIGELEFIKTEYEQVSGGSDATVNGAVSEVSTNGLTWKTDTFQYGGSIDDGTDAANQFMRDKADEADNLFKEFYGAVFDPSTGKYDYNQAPSSSGSAAGYESPYNDQLTGSIAEFINLSRQRCSNTNASFIRELQQAMRDKDKDIAIYRTSLDCVVINKSVLNSSMYFQATYKIKISTCSPTDGEYAYNVVAVYGGTLKKTIEHVVHVATEYKAEAHYCGIARKVWDTYDGMAYYRGAVTKGNSIGNMNPEDDNEVLMFSDAEGYLRRSICVTDSFGNVTTKNFYKIETDYAYLTDVFKNGVACFWKYNLKAPLYDYRGPDERGFYEGDAVKVFTANLKDLPSNYEYNLRLIPAELETVQQIGEGFVPQLVSVPMRYHAELFTSFLSTATDTYRCTYNAFDDNDKNNVALENGATEEIYNYPFMIQNRDFTIESIDPYQRVSKIKLPNPVYIPDTRRYITFTYKVIAERKAEYGVDENGRPKIVQKALKIESYPITASILNKDYVLPAEYVKFDGRAMIISPKVDGIYQSPFDVILADQAAHPPVPQDVNGIYIGIIRDLGGQEISYDANCKYEDQKVYDQSGTQVGTYEEFVNTQEVFITAESTEFFFYTEIIECEAGTRGGINLKCNPDGSGFITAETTIDTGFLDETRQTYTKKLSIDNPYLIEQYGQELRIYPGFKVKCIDARHIKVMPPREDGLLESWYPRIQFGHYSQILDQYGTHTKVCYSMPEYNRQHFSPVYHDPYVDVEKEQVTILNPHMVRTKCYPLLRSEVSLNEDSYRLKETVYRVYKQTKTWQEAYDFCRSVGGTLAMPYNQETSDFITAIADKYKDNGPLWLGNSDPNAYTTLNGFICEFQKLNGVKLYKQVDKDLYPIDIKDISFSEGIIFTNTAVSENDKIVCDYTYLEESYIYRGCWLNDEDFARIDLNPNIYHTYSDMTYTPSETKPSKNLFNKVIYFYLRPSVVFNITSENDDDLQFDFGADYEEKDIQVKNDVCLYHKIEDNMPAADWDIYVGSVYIRQNTSLHSTVIVDGRTRGGGVDPSMKDSLRQQLEPESDFYLDIGYYDGKPYQENGVIIIRLDQRLLKDFGGRFTPGEIEVKVKRWLGLGVYPIIEYVDTYTKQDMPQYSMTVDDTYSNVVDIIPEIYLECNEAL